MFPRAFIGDVLLHSSHIYSSGSGTFNPFRRLVRGGLAAYPAAASAVSRARWQHLEHDPLERAALNGKKLKVI